MDKRNAKQKLVAFKALLESPGWEEFSRELRLRYEKAAKGARDLTTKGRLRAGCAGAANELEQILAHVPAQIATLEMLVEKEKRQVAANPPSLD